jgi:hypothetical protein
VIALVQTAKQCSFVEAARWLADFAGVPAEKTDVARSACDAAWSDDLRWAEWWAVSAEAMADQALEDLPYNDPGRRGMTELLRTIKLGDAALVNEYREWRRRQPELTAAMERAGRQRTARRQCDLARWIRRTYGPPSS